MNNYLDDLMKNHRLISDSSDYDISHDKQIGGKKKSRSLSRTDSSVPSGGFPPIFICTKEEKEREQSETKARGYATSKSSVSIKKILDIRKDPEPFLSL